MQIVVNNSAESTGQLRAVLGSAPEQPWPASALTPSCQPVLLFSLGALQTVNNMGQFTAYYYTSVLPI